MGGIKMDWAFDRISGKPVRRDRMEGVDASDLICCHCPARVNFVDAYTKQSSQRPVRAFFRLNGRQKHTPPCPHDVAAQIELLVAGSRDAEGAHPILEPVGADQHVFRLNILSDATRVCMNLVDADRPCQDEARGATYIRDARMLASYLRSAAGVAKLRARVTDRSDIEGRIRIEYHDKQIPWRDFFYDDDRFEQLHARLSRPGRLRHPVALAVTAKVQREWRTGRWRWLVQCYGDTAAAAAGRKPVIPDLLFADAGLWESILPSREYVVVGDVEAKDDGRFRTLVVRIAHSSQVAPMEIDGDAAVAGDSSG